MFGLDTDSGPIAREPDFEPVLAEESDRQVLPDGLETIPTGPFLAAIVLATDVTRLNGHDAVRYLKASARMESRFAAQRLAATVEVAYSPASGPNADIVRNSEELEFASVEVAAALHLTRRSAERTVDLALSLRERLPQTWEALQSGQIDMARARVLDDETSGVDQETARMVATRVLEAAATLTTGQLRARIQRLVLEVDPESAQQRYEDAVADRALIRDANPDGTANLRGVQLPPHKAGTALARINNHARKLKMAGDSRSVDQIRADIFLDLLNGKELADHGSKGVVDITVELKTLTELSHAPGDLAGYGPVIADIARQVTRSQQTSEWRTTVTNESGDIIHVGTTSRRPTHTMKRMIQAQHHRCVHPGCRMPAINCDIDHRVAVIDGGPTCLCNLTPLCRHHHRAKHEGRWTYVLEHGTQYRWISPLAHHYIAGGRSP
jgi:Domain of unknown function (DUF222)